MAIARAQQLVLLSFALCFSLTAAQLGYPGPQSLIAGSTDQFGAFQTVFSLYDVQPVCSPQTQLFPDGECICVCERYPTNSSVGYCQSEYYTVDYYPFYGNQPSCTASTRAVGQCNCNCRPEATAGNCQPQVTLPLAPSGTQPPPAPGPMTSFDLEFGATPSFYDLGLANITLPGTQTRTNIMAMLPGSYFEEPASSKRKLQQITGQGGWTLVSTDTGVTVIHALPMPDGEVFFWDRPGNREQVPLLASIYNLNTNSYRQFPLFDSAFCGAPVMMYNGLGTIIGGDVAYAIPAVNFLDGRFSVRQFSGGPNPSLTLAATMRPGPYYPTGWPGPINADSGGRWYPSLLTLQDGTIFIASGVTPGGGAHQYSNPTGQVFNPATKALTNPIFMPILAATTLNLYPWLSLLPNGLIMVISGQMTQFYSWNPTAQGTAQLQQNTGYRTVPNLPFQVLYPQTASIHLLPLSPTNNYAPTVMVIGGSSADSATKTTPASNQVFILNLANANPTWQPLTMSAARVMPDGVLLPDGTVCIVNGCEVGVAGASVPGTGLCSSPTGKPQQAEIYNPATQTFSGLLANSGRPRFYHSIAWLSQNAEVIVTGSEATEDYTMQIYTPPYLLGTFNRPVISNPSTKSPAYGSTFTVQWAYNPGSPGIETSPITRMVFNIMNGDTHSVHFDERQVILNFAISGTTITITVPNNPIILPPGNYLLFAVTKLGRPSQGIWIGIGAGGNTNLQVVPAQPYVPATPVGVIPNGNYYIQATSQGTNGGNCPFLSVGTCGQSQTAVTSATPDVWRFTFIARAAVGNVYNINNVKNPTCGNFLAGFSCQPANTAVTTFNTDDRSGRQEFQLTATNGGYFITMPYGRAGCTSLTVTANGCNNAASFSNANQPNQANVVLGASAQWQLTWVPASSAYTAVNLNRNGCGAYLAAYPCNYQTNTLWPFVTSFTSNDGTGKQLFSFTPVQGGHQIAVGGVANANANPPCGNIVTAPQCNGGTTVSYSTAGSGGLQVFSVTPAATAPPAPAVGQPLPNGVYTIASGQRSGTVCPNAAQNYAWIGGCGSSNNVVLSTQALAWTLTYVPNSASIYQVTLPSRNGCYNYMAAYPCNYPSTLTTYNQVDGSGRQLFQFNPQGNGQYQIVMPNGRQGCSNILTADSCAAGTTGISFQNGGAGATQLWTVTSQSSPTPAAITTGTYTIANTVRASCGVYLNVPMCGGGNDAYMGAYNTYQITLLANAPTPNTYQITSLQRSDCAYNMLAAYPCVTGYGPAVTTYSRNDGTGRQQFQIVPVPGGYNILLPNGRQGCPGNYVTAAACNANTAVFFAAAGSGPQLWQITSTSQNNGYVPITTAGANIESAPTPPTPPAIVVSFPSGYYQLGSVGRASCNATGYLGAQLCSNGNAPLLNTGESFYLAFIPGGAFPGTYQIIDTGRTGTCGNLLSAGACSAGDTLSFATADDTVNGLTRWNFNQQPDGSFTVTSASPSRQGQCDISLTAGTCTTSTIGLAGSNIGNGLQNWTVTPYAPPQIIANGLYQLANAAREQCSSTEYLSAPQCKISSTMTLSSGGIFELILLPNAQYPNTYQIKASARGGCGAILSATSCSNASNTALTSASGDNGSGQQQFRFTPAVGGYVIDLPNGRSGCGSFLSAGACGANTLGFTTSNLGSQSTWSLTPAPLTVAQSNTTLANGNYYVLAAAASTCNSYLSGTLCATQTNTAPGTTFVGFAPNDQGFDQEVWTFTAVNTTNNTYNIACSGRGGCNELLKAGACPGTGIGFAASDDGTGMEQYLDRDSAVRHNMPEAALAGKRVNPATPAAVKKAGAKPAADIKVKRIPLKEATLSSKARTRTLRLILQVMSSTL
ncbi:hypothetical protein WJX73_005866 [Symbiochloris irregularis]|uniref:Uncharacterized protein n=1 Tax=Symbiochloris irregularis TaxID=706552 RepID=A0AAW1PIP8_9CHLO